MIWQATVEWTAANPQQSTVEDVMDDLADALADRGGAVGYTAATDTYSTTITVEAGTLRQASAIAVSAVVAATASAGQHKVTPVAVEVITDAEADRRLLEPVFPDVVTTTEAADIVGVSRQRVQQLAAEDPAFPRSLGMVGGHPVYGRAALKVYAAQRDPRPGRRRTA